MFRKLLIWVSRAMLGTCFPQKEEQSVSISVQIIDKSSDTYRVLKTIGSSRDKDEPWSFTIRKNVVVLFPVFCKSP